MHTHTHHKTFTQHAVSLYFNTSILQWLRPRLECQMHWIELNTDKLTLPTCHPPQQNCYWMTFPTSPASKQTLKNFLAFPASTWVSVEVVQAWTSPPPEWLQCCWLRVPVAAEFSAALSVLPSCYHSLPQVWHSLHTVSESCPVPVQINTNDYTYTQILLLARHSLHTVKPA